TQGSRRMSRDLRGCNVLITGASRGIGRCLAEKLAPSGVKLTLAVRDRFALKELVDKLGVAGASVFAVPADVSVAFERAPLIAGAVDKMGGLDVLVNNAGVAGFGHFASSSETVLRTIMEEFLRPGRAEPARGSASDEGTRVVWRSKWLLR